MTADRVALIDWDESHVDVPDLDLVYTTTPPDSTTTRTTLPPKRTPHGKPPSAGTPAGPTSSQPSGSPKFERSERSGNESPPTRTIVLLGQATVRGRRRDGRHRAADLPAVLYRKNSGHSAV